MTTITPTQQVNTLHSYLPSKWQNEGYYTSDELINAYLKGKEDGYDSERKKLIRELDSNTMRAALASQEVLEHAKVNGFEFSSIHLKIDGLESFTALFLTKEEDFLSDKFNEVYKLARFIKKSTENENFHISFSFTPQTQHFSKECLTADGFFMKYENEHKS